MEFRRVILERIALDSENFCTWPAHLEGENMLAALAGGFLVVATLWDAFETIVLPRRVTRRFRWTRLVFRVTWVPWTFIARRVPSRQRQGMLGVFGPLSLILLLSSWALGLLFGFALLQFGFGSHLMAAHQGAGFGTDLYLSGTTLFTLGPGDVTPTTAMAQVLLVLESGTGLGFFAIIIGYFPVVYQAFSRREAAISLLDARAGSPPSAVELIRRHVVAGRTEDLSALLKEWEIWAAELMESHLSYPVLAYYRSQHSNQSWLAALGTLLDASALILAGGEGASRHQAELTFAMARHLLVDLAQVLNRPPLRRAEDRLPAGRYTEMEAALLHADAPLRFDLTAARELHRLRSLYEPYLQSLGSYLFFPLPDWLPARKSDNWQTTAWNRVGRKAGED